MTTLPRRRRQRTLSEQGSDLAAPAVVDLDSLTLDELVELTRPRPEVRDKQNSTSSEGVRDKQNEGCAITYISPQGAEVDKLVELLRGALVARGNRKAMHRPQVPATGGLSKHTKARSTWDRVNLHLRRISRRALNDLAKAGGQRPELEIMTSALEDYVSVELAHLVRVRAPGDAAPSRSERWAYLDAERAQRVAASAARYALDTWSPTYYEEQRRRGSNGGSIGKRTDGTWSQPGNLKTLRIFDPFLTKDQLCEVFGVGRTLIAEGRRLIR